MDKPTSKNPEVTAPDLCRYLDLFEELGITVWLGGGWGVDALLGEQTRRHADLDIVLSKEAAEKLREALFNLGFEDVETDDRTDWNFVMGDDQGHLLDFHVVEFDDRGAGIYGPPERGVSFPASSFTGRGEICGREVHCLDPEFQVESHSGYVIDEHDKHDVLALCARFGLTIPSEYRKNQADNPQDVDER